MKSRIFIKWRGNANFWSLPKQQAEQKGDSILLRFGHDNMMILTIEVAGCPKLLCHIVKILDKTWEFCWEETTEKSAGLWIWQQDFFVGLTVEFMDLDVPLDRNWGGSYAYSPSLSFPAIRIFAWNLIFDITMIRENFKRELYCQQQI